MLDTLYIAWKYVRFNKGKAIILVASITLMSFLPLSLQFLLERSEEREMNEVQRTPPRLARQDSAIEK